MQTININALAATRIILGKQGENQATKIAFRVASFLAMWPNATVALAVQPPQGNAYPATVTLEDGVASWIISSADTAYAGDGKCELRILDGEVVKKSVTFPTRIIQSFTAAGEAPDIVKDWIEDAQEKLGEVETATASATAAAESIDNMTVSASGLAAGANPTVAVSDVDGHKHIAFGIPKGDAGDQDPHGGGLTSAVKAALLQLAQKVAYVDNGGQTYYSALYDALYAAELVSISASFSQGSTVVHASDSLNTLKSMLTVTATYSDSTTAAVTDYTLSGTLTEGTSTITVTYGGKTATFSVTVSAPVTLSSISASFSQGNTTVYESDSLDTLKTMLTVTATYSDSTTRTVSDYTLSGTLTEGTSTVTVTYGGKTATFTVSVTAAEATLSSISAAIDLNGNIIRTSNSLNDLKQYLTVTATYSDSSTETVSDYTLSGSLALASGSYETSTNTITISYGGKTATVNVKVYNAMTKSKATLPSGYTQLVAVTSTGATTCYVDTGIGANLVDHVKFGVQALTGINNSTNCHVLSSRYLWYPYFRKGGSGATNFLAMNRNSAAAAVTLEATWEANTNYEVEAFSPNAVINGTDYGEVQNKGANDTTSLYVFARNSSTGAKDGGKIRLFYIEVYNDQNQLIHNFVPCKNSSDVAGLYDTVGTTFYQSSGSTAIGAGEVM